MYMVNSHANYELEPAGQEAFTIIQYNPADQYTCVDYDDDDTTTSILIVNIILVVDVVLYCCIEYK